jgi:hypothetical protein
MGGTTAALHSAVVPVYPTDARYQKFSLTFFKKMLDNLLLK